MAETAFGTVFVIGSTTVGKVKSISGGGETLNMFDTSNMDSDTVLKLPGLISGKPMTIGLEYEDTTNGNYATCLTAIEARTTTTCSLTFTDTSTVTCLGYVSDISNPEGETESELTFTVECTPQTVWTRTGAS